MDKPKAILNINHRALERFVGDDKLKNFSNDDHEEGIIDGFQNIFNLMYKKKMLNGAVYYDIASHSTVRS